MRTDNGERTQVSPLNPPAPAGHPPLGKGGLRGAESPVPTGGAGEIVGATIGRPLPRDLRTCNARPYGRAGACPRRIILRNRPPSAIALSKERVPRRGGCGKWVAFIPPPAAAQPPPPGRGYRGVESPPPTGGENKKQHRKKFRCCLFGGCSISPQRASERSTRCSIRDDRSWAQREPLPHRRNVRR